MCGSNACSHVPVYMGTGIESINFWLQWQNLKLHQGFLLGCNSRARKNEKENVYRIFSKATSFEQWCEHEGHRILLRCGCCVINCMWFGNFVVVQILKLDFTYAYSNANLLYCLVVPLEVSTFRNTLCLHKMISKSLIVSQLLFAAS